MPREAVIRAVRPIQIHADRYYEIAFSYDGEPEVVRQARLPDDAIYANPQEGDQVLVQAILNMVTEVKKKP